MRTIKRIVAGTGLGLGLLVIIVLALLPVSVKHYAVKHGRKLTGREIAINQLRVKYFGGKARITDFVMYEEDGITEFVSFDTMLVDLKPLRLLKDEFFLQQFYLAGLRAVLIQDDSVFNFSDLVAYHSDQPDTVKAPPAEKEPLKYFLSNMELKHARFEYENKNVGNTLLLRDLSFFVPYIGWNQEEQCEGGLRFMLNEKGYVEAQVQVQPDEGDFIANINIHSLLLEGFREYASQVADIHAMEGVFDARLDIRGNIRSMKQSLVSGEAEIRDLYLSDAQKKQFLGANAVRTSFREIDLHRSRFLVDSVILAGPYVYFELKDSTNNFTEILHIPADEADSSGRTTPVPDTVLQEQSDPIYYAIRSFVMQNGTVDFRDRLSGEPFDYHLTDMTIRTDSIESTSEQIRVYSSMVLNHRGHLKAEASFNPLQPGPLRLDFTVVDFLLSDLNIYSRYYTGFPVIYGDMYYRGHTEVVDHQLVSDNNLVLQHVELGVKKGGLIDLPLKFALFILKDRNGVIDLDIPVRGRTDDPTVTVGQIIWNTLKNLVIRAATAPYDFLAGMLGTDPSDIESIEYDYMDTTLTNGRQRQLDLLLELEQLKEDLEIELVYFNDVGKEKELIARAMAAADSTKAIPADTSKAIPADTVQLAEEGGAPAMQLADSLATVFGTTRRQQIERYLREKNDSTLIHITVPDPGSPAHLGSPPRFEVKYSMKMEDS